MLYSDQVVSLLKSMGWWVKGRLDAVFTKLDPWCLMVSTSNLTGDWS